MIRENGFAERLTALRMRKGVSARKMSLDIAQNESYINNIENGHGLPSLAVFFYICDYLQITPKDFFDEGMDDPQALGELFEDIKTLNDEQIQLLKGFVKQMKKTAD